MTNSNQTTPKAAEHGLSAKTATPSAPSQAGTTAKSRVKKKSRHRVPSAGQSQSDLLSLLRKNFLTELSGLLDAENQLVAALPKVEKKAHSTGLKRIVNHHLLETREHVRRIHAIFIRQETEPATKNCASMKAILEEVKPLLSARKKNAAADAQLIGVAQKVEHYEIAAYGTLRAWARQLGDRQSWDLLSQTLEEEKHADYALTAISEDADDVPASADPSTETAHQERSIMPTQQNHRGRSGRGNQERDEHGRFESHDGGRHNTHASSSSHSSSNRGRGQHDQNGRQGSSYSSQERNQGGSRSGYSNDYERDEDQNYGRQNSGRNQGGPERDENGRFESSSPGRSSAAGRQDWNDQDGHQGSQAYGRSQSPQYRERDENGRFQSEDEDNQYSRNDRNQDWNENQNSSRQNYGRSQNRPPSNTWNDNSGSQSSQAWNEDQDSDRQNYGSSNSHQGWGQDRDYDDDNRSQGSRRSGSYGRSSNEQSSYN